MTRMLPRALLAMLTLVALSVGLVACGGGGDEKSAKETLQAASKKEVKSGNLNLTMAATLRGVQQLNGPLRLTMKGPFESHGQNEYPTLDWDISASGAGQSLNAGLIILPDNAFVEFRGTNYEAGEATMKRLLDQAKKQQKDSPTTLKELGVQPADWLVDGKVEDGEEIGGAATEKVTGKLDVTRMLRDFNKILEQPQFRSQLPPGSSVSKISEENIKKVEQAVKNPTIEVSVGKDDDTIRRTAAKVGFDVPQDLRSQLNGFSGGNLSFTMTMTDIGKKPNVKAPSGARPLTELLQSLGIPPSALNGAGALAPQGG